MSFRHPLRLIVSDSTVPLCDPLLTLANARQPSVTYRTRHSPVAILTASPFTGRAKTSRYRPSRAPELSASVQNGVSKIQVESCCVSNASALCVAGGQEGGARTGSPSERSCFQVSRSSDLPAVQRLVDVQDLA